MSRGSSSELAEGAGEHVVQFYGTDDQLAVTVCGYLAEGIRSGDGVLVVATAPHQRALEAALIRADVDVEAEQRAGRVLFADAGELLAGFLAADRLDHSRFRSLAGGLVRDVAGSGRPVRIYAEMVALLWDDGQVALALELEELWNELGERLPFALLCGYPARLLAEPGGDDVREMSRLHSAVAGLETAADAGGAAVRSFPRELDSARGARYFTTGALDPAIGEGVACDAAIVATELAANALLHARSEFTITVSRSAAGIRIAVRDRAPLSGDGHFLVREGHGLSLVSQLASNWAVEGLPDGKVVWAEIPASSLLA